MKESEFEGFSEASFSFYHELAFNNSKTWFEANKSRYEQDVVEPALALIRAMHERIQRISPHYRGVAKKLGGSMMRIHRDVRFSRDKTPYKTNLGIQFRHVQAADVHAPGFYFNLAPGDCFIGAGAWHPEPEQLALIRRAIEADPTGYEKALQASISKSGMESYGDKAVRVPTGFDPQHPAIEHIKRKDFILTRELDQQQYLDKGLLDLLENAFAATAPYMAFLCKALGAPF